MSELNRLIHAQIKGLPVGKHCDGGGLWLEKRPDGGAQWFYRYTLHRRRREMGLGGLSAVSLKEARLQAEKWRAVVRKGKDAINERERERREGERQSTLLKDIAEDAFETRKAQLKGDGKAGRWFTPLERHVLPKLGMVPVGDLTQHDVKRVLEPIWHTKAETARKALNRLAIVLQHAAALDLMVDLQITAKAKALLGKSRHQPKNIGAIPWQEVPAFYSSLSEPTVTHLALRLLILTGVRSRPLRFLRTENIDGDVWTVPAELMKGLKDETEEFLVPLSQEAQRVIEMAAPFERDGYIFPSQKKGVISDATMSRLMERRGMEERPHGFRSSLRDWLADATDAPKEVADTILAHAAGTKVEKAYRRTQYLEKRRILMERWAQYVTGETGQVVKIA